MGQEDNNNNSRLQQSLHKKLIEIMRMKKTQMGILPLTRRENKKNTKKWETEQESAVQNKKMESQGGGGLVLRTEEETKRTA